MGHRMPPIAFSPDRPPLPWKQNLGSIRPGVFAPHIGEIYTPPCSKFTTLFFFWFFRSPTGESVRPIFTLNTSNDAVLRKEVPFDC